MLRNWNARFCQPVDVAASAPTIGSNIAMPTATRLLSPRNGIQLSFRCARIEDQLRPSLLAGFETERERDHDQDQTQVGRRLDDVREQDADDDDLGELLPVAHRVVRG